MQNARQHWQILMILLTNGVKLCKRVNLKLQTRSTKIYCTQGVITIPKFHIKHKLKMSLLDAIINVLNTNDVPEMICKYLAGDDCLDDETISSVFQRPHKNKYGYTYMDKDCTVLHSFNDEPALKWTYGETQKQEWYRNGRVDRIQKPAIIVLENVPFSLGTFDHWIKIYIHNRKIHRITENDGDQEDQQYDIIHEAYRNFLIGKAFTNKPNTPSEFNLYAYMWSEDLRADNFTVTNFRSTITF